MFLALNPDGSVKWRRTTNVAIATPAVDGEGTIYVGTDLATLYAINPDGSLKWSYNDGGLFNYVRTPPAIGDDHRVYAGSGLGVFAIGEL